MIKGLGSHGDCRPGNRPLNFKLLTNINKGNLPLRKGKLPFAKEIYILKRNLETFSISKLNNLHVIFLKYWVSA